MLSLLALLLLLPVRLLSLLTSTDELDDLIFLLFFLLLRREKHKNGERCHIGMGHSIKCINNDVVVFNVSFLGQNDFS